MNSTRRWVKRLQEADIPPHFASDQFSTLTRTKQKWNELRTEVMEYVNSLDENQLEQTIHWELPARGMQMDNPRWEILLHVANHATDHRAQILGMLHHYFNVRTVEQDMLFYILERKQA